LQLSPQLIRPPTATHGPMISAHFSFLASVLYIPNVKNKIISGVKCLNILKIINGGILTSLLIVYIPVENRRITIIKIAMKKLCL
jgi:hypothetical protein